MRFGEAAIRREGDDVTIIGISRMAITAQKAAETLADEHEIEAEVIDPRTLRPLDLDTILESVEEDQPRGDRRGGLAARRRRREPRRADPGAGLRLARRAGPARHRRRRADAVLQAARAGRLPARGARRAGGARHLQGPLGGDQRMATDVTMPRLSDSMEEGTVLKWLVEEGGEVKRGEPLVEIETDKANMTYEADTDGVLVEVVAQEGDTLADRRGDRAHRRRERGQGGRRAGGAERGARRGAPRPRQPRPRPRPEDAEARAAATTRGRAPRRRRAEEGGGESEAGPATATRSASRGQRRRGRRPREGLARRAPDGARARRGAGAARGQRPGRADRQGRRGGRGRRRRRPGRAPSAAPRSRRGGAAPRARRARAARGEAGREGRGGDSGAHPPAADGSRRMAESKATAPDFRSR